MNRFSRICEALMEVCWLLALIIVPLFFNSDSYRIFDVNKIALFRLIMLTGLMAWGGKLIIQERGSNPFALFKHALEEFLKIPLVIPVVALALVMLISSMFSISPLTSLMGSSTRFEGVFTLLCYVFLFVLVAANLRARQQLERLVAVLAAVCLAVDAYAIVQHFGLDPFVWQADVKSRAFSTIGHPIFSAAFLSMALFVLVGRAMLAFQSFLRRGVSRLADLTRALLFSLVSILNLVAIWYADSRGPLLGLFFGLGLFSVLFLLTGRMRRALAGMFAVAAVLAALLVLLNLPNSRLTSLRSGPLASLFDAQTGTGRMRILIWQGMARLTGPHAPLLFPDGAPDRWNRIRWLVGYGPDTLRLGYEGYYNPEMYRLESREFLTDRAHNEFWDLLYFYGFPGLIAKFSIFLAIFYYGLRWLGLIASTWERKLYWGLALGGGLLGAIFPAVIARPELIGLGCPLGLLGGLAGVIIYRVFRPCAAGQTPLAAWQSLSMISILAAVLSHYIEILFGISVITSALLLWMMAGVLAWPGWVLSNGLAGESAAVPLILKPALEQPQPAASGRQVTLEKFRGAAINAGLLSLIMVTLGAGFLSTVQMSGSVGQTLFKMFILTPDRAAQPSYAVLVMFMGVLLVGALLLQLGDDALAGGRPNWRSLLLSLGSALLISVLAWVIRASQLVSLQQALTRQDAAAISEGVIGLLTGSLLSLFLIVVCLVFVLARRPAEPVISFKGSWLTALGLALVLLPAWALLMPVSLDALQANILFAQVVRFSIYPDYPAALKVYDQVLQLAPTENDHLRFAAGLYAEAINHLSDPAGKERYFQTGLKYTQQAAALEPLSIDNTIALARLYRLGGDFSADPALKNLRFFMANTYFVQALKVKPGRIDYWLDWAKLQALAGDIQGAFDKVEAALRVDDTYAPAYQLLGDLHAIHADSLPDPAARVASFTIALQAYQKQAELLASQGSNAAPAFFDVGRVYESVQQYSLAREAYTRAAELGMGEFQWRVYKRIADVSALLKDYAGQRQSLQKALELAPQTETAALLSEINALKP